MKKYFYSFWHSLTTVIEWIERHPTTCRFVFELFIVVIAQK